MRLPDQIQSDLHPRRPVPLGSRVRVTTPRMLDDVVREGVLVQRRDADPSMPAMLRIEIGDLSDLRSDRPGTPRTGWLVQDVPSLDLEVLETPAPGRALVVCSIDSPAPTIRWVGEDEADAHAWLAANRSDWRAQGDIAVCVVPDPDAAEAPAPWIVVAPGRRSRPLGAPGAEVFVLPRPGGALLCVLRPEPDDGDDVAFEAFPGDLDHPLVGLWDLAAGLLHVDGADHPVDSVTETAPCALRTRQGAWVLADGEDEAGEGDLLLSSDRLVVAVGTREAAFAGQEADEESAPPSTPIAGIVALDLMPTDDASRSFSDTLLPETMVFAGMAALDRAHADMAAYRSGETIDWDDGMIAVAVWRAMAGAWRTARGAFVCSLDGRPETAAAVEADDAIEAARSYAEARARATKDLDDATVVVDESGIGSMRFECRHVGWDGPDPLHSVAPKEA